MPPPLHSPRLGISAVRRAGKGLDKVWDRPLHAGTGRASHFSQFSLAQRPQSRREANPGPPLSPHCEGERQICSRRWGQPQPPRARRHRPEIGSLPPLSLRKPGPSPGGEVLGAEAPCCPQINALSCLQRICAFKTSSQGLPGLVWALLPPLLPVPFRLSFLTPQI